MQKFSEVDGGNPDGTAKDRDGVIAGTSYLAKYYNDNIFNLFKFVENAGYTLIDDDLSQVVKAARGLYNATFTYNSNAIATQSVTDIVLGSDGIYYEVQDDGVTNDNPVGSETGKWEVYAGNNVLLTTNQTIAGIKTFGSFPITPSSNPTTNFQVSNKQYTDTKAGKDTVNTFTKGQVGEQTALTSGANISLDLSDSNHFKLTLEENATLDNPTNITAGQSGFIIVTQDATGGRTLAFDTYYKFSGGEAPVLTSTVGAVDLLAYYVLSSTSIVVNSVLEIS